MGRPPDGTRLGIDATTPKAKRKKIVYSKLPMGQLLTRFRNLRHAAIFLSISNPQDAYTSLKARHVPEAPSRSTMRRFIPSHFSAPKPSQYTLPHPMTRLTQHHRPEALTSHRDQSAIYDARRVSAVIDGAKTPTPRSWTRQGLSRRIAPSTAERLASNDRDGVEENRPPAPLCLAAHRRSSRDGWDDHARHQQDKEER